MRFTRLAAVCLLSARCLAQSPEHPIELGTSYDPDGVMRTYSVSSARIAKSPAWSPENGPVPLSMERALAIGRLWLVKQNPKFEGFVPTHFTLSAVSHSKGQRSWVWSLQFEPVLGGRTLMGPSFEAYVLLDGSVVEPVVSKGQPPSVR